MSLSSSLIPLSTRHLGLYICDSFDEGEVDLCCHKKYYKSKRPWKRGCLIQHEFS